MSEHIVFVTYATSAHYEEQRNLSIQLAKNMGVTNFLNYTQNDLKQSFKEEYAHILQHSRGSGYWVWKPYIILETMLNTNAEIVIYCDSGSGTTETLQNIINKVRAYKLVGFELVHLQSAWTKRDAFILTDTDNSRQHNALQRCATMLAIVNTPETRQFVQQWLDYCKDERIVTDQSNVLGSDYTGFKENRHDQTIFSLLTYKIGIGMFFPITSLLHHSVGSILNPPPPKERSKTIIRKRSISPTQIPQVQRSHQSQVQRSHQSQVQRSHQTQVQRSHQPRSIPTIHSRLRLNSQTRQTQQMQRSPHPRRIPTTLSRSRLNQSNYTTRKSSSSSRQLLIQRTSLRRGGFFGKGNK